MLVSILIPAYNEAKRLPLTLNKITDFISKANKDMSFEVIVVSDGSKDNTSQIVKEFGFTAVEYVQNQGKGYALRYGLDFCNGDYVYLCDSDLSTPIEEIYSFLEKKDNADLVIGSRALENSKVDTVGDRKAAGRFGNFLINLLLGLGLKDTQCGFKLLNRSAVGIFKKGKINRWGFDFELLYLAKINKLKTLEIPVEWKHDDNSKVKFSHYFYTLYELLKVLWLHHVVFNKYKQFIIYVSIGILGIIWDLAAFFIFFNLLKVDVYISNIISMSVGITHNFILNTIFNFKVKNKIVLRYISFYAVGIVGMIISSGLLYIFYEKIGIPANISKVLILPIIAVIQFFLNKFISFRKSKA